jgi:hypothetical protein
MKTKKVAAVLPAIFLISFLFSGCMTGDFTAFLMGLSREYYYEERQYINTEYFNLRLAFLSSSPPSVGYTPVRNKDSYYPYVNINFSEGKFIKNILINRVIINTGGGNEYSMTGKEITRVYCEYKRHIDDRYESGLYLKGDDLDDMRFIESLDDIRRTGYIDFGKLASYVPDIMNDENYPFNFFSVSIYFTDVLLFHRRQKEIRIHYNFSVELVTGETITINQEVIAKRRLRYHQTHWGILPTV